MKHLSLAACLLLVIAAPGAAAAQSNTPAFSVHKNGTSQAVTADAWALLTWNTKTFDTTSNFDLALGRFTPNAAGKYLIEGAASCNSGTECYVMVRRDGVPAQGGFSRNGSADQASVTAILDMNGTTDYVDLLVYVTGGAMVGGHPYDTYFSGSLVNATAATTGGVISYAGGNVGIGAVPQTWDAGWKALELPFGASLAGYNNGIGGNTMTALSTNMYSPAGGGYRYITNDFATAYYQYAGGHYWRVAPRGTAGSPLSWTAAMAIDNGGNVGIGTIAPAARLHVAGDVKVDGNIAARYQDVAEWVDSAEPLAAGTLVVVDAASANRVVAATESYDSRVAGAVSAQPGVVLGEPGAGRVLVAQSGRVRVKVDATYGAIRAGDLLVSSPTKGAAMRSEPIDVAGTKIYRAGTLIGKALEPLDAGTGEILVLLTLQ